MTITGIDHVQLAMPEGGEERARSFYGGLLGFLEVPKPDALAGRGGAWFRSGTATLHLGVEPGFVPARKAHPAFLVDDLEVLAARLRRAGVDLVTDVPLPGYRRFHASDPFGNRIELLEKL